MASSSLSSVRARSRPGSASPSSRSPPPRSPRPSSRLGSAPHAASSSHLFAAPGRGADLGAEHPRRADHRVLRQRQHAVDRAAAQGADHRRAAGQGPGTPRKVQQRVAAGAAAAYRTGGLDPTLSLVSSGTPQTFLDQTASLDEVARYDANQVAYADAAQRRSPRPRSCTTPRSPSSARRSASISSEKSQIQGLLNQQNQLLDRLKASQRAALARQQTATVQHQVALRTSYTPAGLQRRGKRSRGGGDSLRVRPARQALPVGRRRSEQLRLLGSDDAVLGCGRRRPPAQRGRPAGRAAGGVTVRARARRPGLLRRSGLPHRDLHRWRPTSSRRRTPVPWCQISSVGDADERRAPVTTVSRPAAGRRSGPV